MEVRTPHLVQQLKIKTAITEFVKACVVLELGQYVDIGILDLDTDEGTINIKFEIKEHVEVVYSDEVDDGTP